MRAGFPHSEICGSKPICRLPAAYRRLSRPSSPVIAKASTTCTYSLDPITLPPGAFKAPSTPGQSPPEHLKAIGNSHACACIPERSRDQRHDAIHNPVSPRPEIARNAARALSKNENNFTFYPILLKSSRSVLRVETSEEEAPSSSAKSESCLLIPHHGRRWWSQSGSNR